jgi:hypothetical protein
VKSRTDDFYLGSQRFVCRLDAAWFMSMAGLIGWGLALCAVFFEVL